MPEYGAIDGVELHKPAVFLDERGQVRRYMRSDDEWFSGFAEVYFSIVNPGVVKAWHLHKEMTLCYGCIHGDIMLGLYDGEVGPYGESDVVFPAHLATEVWKECELDNVRPRPAVVIHYDLCARSRELE